MKPFYDLTTFPEFSNLANQYQIILDELKNSAFWLNWGSDNGDPLGHCNFLSGNWTVCPLYFGNYNAQSFKITGIENNVIEKIVNTLPTQFSKTTTLMKKVNSINFAAFSRLHPKSSLAPHKHENPYSLIFHLGLIIPPKSTCGLTVGGKIHTWKKPGDAVIFNDTLEHSAWNHSDEDRIVLYVDFNAPKH